MTHGVIIALASLLCLVTVHPAAEGGPQTAPAKDAPKVMEVPRGEAPVIDGVLSEGEWGGSLTLPMSNDGKIRLMQDGKYLYVALQGERGRLGSLCLRSAEEISVLHSSAALGTAVYRSDGDRWRRIREFDWRCRAREESPERREYLAREGWMASIVYMGPSEEMEYQIDLEEEMTLAAVFRLGPGKDQHRWPVSLEGACARRELVDGNTPETMPFRPDRWIMLRPAGE